MNGRKGTDATVRGFIKAGVDAKLLIRTQTPIDQYKCYDEIKSSKNIEVFEGTVPDNVDLYAEGDVLIYCSKYDGQSLVAEEGMCAGMPVITTDAEPMNEYWPSSHPLLVKVRDKVASGTINPRCLANLVDEDDLAKKIKWCYDNDMSEISANNRSIIEKEYSWNVLKPRWEKILE